MAHSENVFMCGFLLLDVCRVEARDASESQGNLERGIPIGHESAGLHVDHLGRSVHEIRRKGAFQGRRLLDTEELGGGTGVVSFQGHLEGMLTEGLVHAGNLCGFEVL